MKVDNNIGNPFLSTAVLMSYSKCRPIQCRRLVTKDIFFLTSRASHSSLLSLVCSILHLISKLGSSLPTMQHTKFVKRLTCSSFLPFTVQNLGTLLLFRIVIVLVFKMVIFIPAEFTLTMKFWRPTSEFTIKNVSLVYLILLIHSINHYFYRGLKDDNTYPYLIISC